MVCFYLSFSSAFLNPRAVLHNLDLPKDLPESLGILHQFLNLFWFEFSLESPWNPLLPSMPGDE